MAAARRYTIVVAGPRGGQLRLPVFVPGFHGILGGAIVGLALFALTLLVQTSQVYPSAENATLLEGDGARAELRPELVREFIQNYRQARELERQLGERQSAITAQLLPVFSDHKDSDISATPVRDIEAYLRQNLALARVYAGFIRIVPYRVPLDLQRPRVTSGFGVRANPFYGEGGPSNFHRGVDLRAGYGTAVLASAAGFVVEVRRSTQGYGNMVRVVHPSGYETVYAHLQNIDVQKNQSVRPGQRLGTAGATGLATGPHLHYEIRQNGRPLDPRPFFLTR